MTPEEKELEAYTGQGYEALPPHVRDIARKGLKERYAVHESWQERDKENSPRHDYEKMVSYEHSQKLKAFQDSDTQEIDVDTIELIHGIERQQDGFISICRKINSEHQDLAGIRVAELRQWLPKLLPWLVKDSYFSVNASYRAAPYNSNVTGLSSAWRKEKHLRYLNACYADMDCYKAGLAWPDALRIIAMIQENNLIPPASIIGRSGRGLYLLWLLTSQRQGAQQRAFPHEIELYKQINRSLIESLNKYEPRLQADVRAIDAARLLRVPGSLNSKAKDPVKYIVQATSGGLAPVFTLKYLAEFLRLPAIPQLPTSFYKRLVKDPGSCPARRRGRIGRARKRLSDLMTLFQHRCGFEYGTRRRSLTFVALFAKTAGCQLSHIQKLIQGLAADCRPPYPSEPDDIAPETIVKNVWVERGKNPRSDKLAGFFKVTPQLAEELNLQSIVPAEIREERKALPPARLTARHARRNAIRHMLKGKGTYPSIRKLQARLERLGLSASFETVRKDRETVLAELRKNDLPARSQPERVQA